ncbi:hypothetical protein [Streptomyces sp. NPDC056468]|uniref:hypothetical protein n=1 Tax=Streptomyces sp. NPDC056468 TaxID=3345830 RepID=UPI003685187D
MALLHSEAGLVFGVSGLVLVLVLVAGVEVTVALGAVAAVAVVVKDMAGPARGAQDADSVEGRLPAADSSGSAALAGTDRPSGMTADGGDGS